MTWNVSAETPTEFGERIDAWLEYFRAEGIAAIAYGGLVLRRRGSGDNWFRTIHLPNQRGQGSDHILRLFAAYEGRAGIADEGLLDRVAAIAPDTLFESRNRALDGEWKTTDAALAIDGGLGFRTVLDLPATALLARIARPQRVSDVLEAAAAASGLALEVYAPPALALLRRLTELGFVELRRA